MGGGDSKSEQQPPVEEDAACDQDSKTQQAPEGEQKKDPPLAATDATPDSIPAVETKSEDPLEPPGPTSTAVASTSTADEEVVDDPDACQVVEEPAFDIEALRTEVESLRANLPPYVVNVGTLKMPTLLCDEDGQLVKPSGGDPWDLTASVRGAEGDDNDAEATTAEAAAETATDLWEDAETKAKAAEREVSVAMEALDLAKDPSHVQSTHWSLSPSVGTWYCRFNYDTEWKDKEDAEATVVKEMSAARAESISAAEDALQKAKHGLIEARALARELEKKAKSADRAKVKAQYVAAYNFPFQIRIRFEKSWPKSTPDVRFQCVMHHALIDESGGMLLPFYRTLSKDPERQVYTLRLVLEAVHGFLVDPLAAWGVPAEAAPQRLLASLQANQVMNTERLSTIRKYATRVKHKELFETPARWREEWFDPGFWKAHTENTPEAWRSILIEHMPGEVFSLKIFTEKFCEMFVEEVFNFYGTGLPARRPNSMNNYGIILNEIGLEPMIDELQNMLQPLGELLYPGPGSVWDGHHCFIVRYRKGEDLGLDMHTDDSDTTVNICLGLDFTDSLLRICGTMGAGDHRKLSYTYSHVKGSAVVHLGRRRHGADDLGSGERMNLILWNHSSTYRSSDEYRNPPYITEEGPPDEVCVSYTHDRDYGIYKEYPVGKEKFKGRGWCPPKQYEYENFKVDAESIIGG